MKDFLRGNNISLKLFYKYIYISSAIILYSAFLLEFLSVKVSDTSAGYFPAFSMFFAPVVLWILTQIQFLRYKKLFINQGKFKLMWFLAAFPFTYAYVYILVPLLPLVVVSFIFMAFGLLFIV